MNNPPPEPVPGVAAVEPRQLLDQIARNRRIAIGLVGAYVLTFASLFRRVLDGSGSAIAGALVLCAYSAGVAWFLWRSMDRIVLGLSRAVPASATEHAVFHNVVEGLCLAAGMPEPTLYVMTDDAPNAFVMGSIPERAVVVVTTGGLGRWNRAELEAVVACQLSRVRTRDVRLATLMLVPIGVWLVSSCFLVLPTVHWVVRSALPPRVRIRLDAVVAVALVLIAPQVVLLWALTVLIRRGGASRADACAAELTRNPEALISALDAARVGPGMAEPRRVVDHLCFVSPWSSRDLDPAPRWRGFYDIHPTIDERIARLRVL